jgi:hypothetical protein
LSDDRKLLGKNLEPLPSPPPPMSLRSVFTVTPVLRGACNTRTFSSASRVVPRANNASIRAVTNTRLTTKSFPRSRFYSTDSGASKGSGATVWVLLGVAAAAGAGYYVYSNPKEAESALKSGKQSAKAAAGFTPKLEDYQKVYNTVAELLDEAGDYDGKWLPVCDLQVFFCSCDKPDGSYGPVLVRLAWHCSGTYDKESKTGGRFGGFIAS